MKHIAEQENKSIEEVAQDMMSAIPTKSIGDPSDFGAAAAFLGSVQARYITGQNLLVHGEKTLMGEFKLARGAVIPPHSHPHEQTGILIAGKLCLNVDGSKMDADAGDSWCLPGGVEHSVEVLEDSLVIEVFSPVREDYLD